MQDGLSEVVLILVGSTVIILVLIGLVVFALFNSQQRKYRYRQEMTEMKNTYEKEVLQTQIETQHQTFATISQELHDNVGTLLSIAIVHLKTIAANENTHRSVLMKSVSESTILVDEALDLLRDISRSINPDNISRIGLNQSFTNEIERLKKIKVFDTEYISEGDQFDIEPKHQIILFRIVQESLNNIVKHSGASKVSLYAKFAEPSIEIRVTDNGRGFEMNESTRFENRSGIQNMVKRARIINASFRINSEPEKGTTIWLSYPGDRGKMP